MVSSKNTVDHACFGMTFFNPNNNAKQERIIVMGD